MSESVIILLYCNIVGNRTTTEPPRGGEIWAKPAGGVCSQKFIFYFFIPHLTPYPQGVYPYLSDEGNLLIFRALVNFSLISR